MEEPQLHLGAIARFLGVDPMNLPFAGEKDVKIGPTHTVTGNPSRFSEGIVHLDVDRTWERQMSGVSRLLATIPALPLMHRYSYPQRVGTTRSTE